MEVLTIISTDKDVINLFYNYLERSDIVIQSDKDNDTIFYKTANGNRNEIYFHNQYVDFIEELKYNYEAEEKKEVNTYFKNKNLFAFDISYRSEQVMENLLSSFKDFLTAKGFNSQSILVSHPFNGINNL